MVNNIFKYRKMGTANYFSKDLKTFRLNITIKLSSYYTFYIPIDFKIPKMIYIKEANEMILVPRSFVILTVNVIPRYNKQHTFKT